MDILSSIRQPIVKELEDFQELFGSSLQHTNPILGVALRHVLQRKGKMMRPIMVLLWARYGGEVNKAVLHAAAALEMLHTASLVHDDVVDESDRRRGQKSVNALLDNKAAVLVGDYMLSTALQHAALTQNSRVVEWVSLLGKTLAEGEIKQLSNIESGVIDEESYLDVIRKKTASLFETCAMVGAYLSGASEEHVESARLFGEYVGMCFQLRDDIFDYFDASEIGKPTGNDMREGKLTLPVIYAVLQEGAEDMRALAFKVRAGEATAEEIAQLVDFTKKSGGIKYAQRTMMNYHACAIDLLKVCDRPEVANSLRMYADFAANRTL